MRLRSNSNVNEIEISHEFRILSKQQQSELQSKFRKNQQGPGRGISFYDLVNILELCGFKISEQRKYKLNKDILAKEIKIIDLNTLYWAATALKRQRQDNIYENNAQNSEYLDAFIALGGNSDKSGYVNKDNLMKILKQQFGIMFEIDKLTDGLEFSNGDKLQFSQFCELFDRDRAQNLDANVLGLLSSRHGSEKQLQFTQKQFMNYENTFEHLN